MEEQQTHTPQNHGDTAYTTAIVDRLAAQYLARTTLPGTDQPTLTIERFHRLYWCVMAEGYGQ